MMRGTIQLVSVKGETICIVFECIAIEGRRKQFLVVKPTSHTAIYVYREFKVMIGHKYKLLCKA